MPKIKTHKATAKRIVITKTKKIRKRKAGQDHFNSRETGNTTRQKRKDMTIAKSEARTIKALLPYK